jgi:hypothetical protein
VLNLKNEQITQIERRSNRLRREVLLYQQAMPGRSQGQAVCINRQCFDCSSEYHKKRNKAKRDARIEALGGPEVVAARKAEASKAKQIARAKRRRAKGCDGDTAKRRRTPPWLTAAERAELEAHCGMGTEGRQSDHMIPYSPAGRIAGIHVIDNLQRLDDIENNRKSNRLALTEAEEQMAIWAELAVWKADISDKGRVNWQPYVGDKLADFFERIAEQFGNGGWIVGELLSNGIGAEGLCTSIRRHKMWWDFGFAS